MTLILNDALNLSYYLVKTTVTGAITGGSWLYEKLTDTTVPTIDNNPNDYPAITMNNNSPQLTIELSNAEHRLLKSFLELPNWKKEQYMCSAMLQYNNEILQHFSFGERSPLTTIRFSDLRTNLPLAYIYVRLDQELTIGNLCDQLRKQASNIKPNIYDRDWFILKPEQIPLMPSYNPQLSGSLQQQVFHKIHIKPTDSVSIILSMKEIDGLNYEMMTVSDQINDVFVDT